jgi:tRNA (guanine-N7-)-methyltransferase
MPNPIRSDRYEAVVASRKQGLTAHFATIFASKSEFVWEIGCGHGHFLTAYAHDHPDRLCVGIDISTERIERATRKHQRSKLPNLHFVQAEARVFLETLPAHARVADIFVLFPDPWPKLRHRKHRLLQPEFLRLAADRATPTARFFFRTDYQPYFNEVVAMLGPDVGWRRSEDAWPYEFETVFQSRAEAFHSLTARRASAEN